jgi:hypothetical protein
VAVLAAHAGPTGSSFANRNGVLGIQAPDDSSGSSPDVAPDAAAKTTPSTPPDAAPSGSPNALSGGDHFGSQARALAARALEIGAPGVVRPELVRVLFAEARGSVAELEEWGARLRRAAAGELLRVPGCFAPAVASGVLCDDLPGLFALLARRFRTLGGVFLEPGAVFDLAPAGDGTWRVLLAADGAARTVTARCVVAALGGPAPLFARTLAGPENPGVAHALLARAGARLANTGFVQFAWHDAATHEYFPLQRAAREGWEVAPGGAAETGRDVAGRDVAGRDEAGRDVAGKAGPDMADNAASDGAPRPAPCGADAAAPPAGAPDRPCSAATPVQADMRSDPAASFVPGLGHLAHLAASRSAHVPMANEAETAQPNFHLEDAALDVFLLAHAAPWRPDAPPSAEPVGGAGLVRVRPPGGEWRAVALFAQAGNGGALIDAHGRTSAPGLYACGECATGMHGANRLGGAMAAAALVFGRRAGRAAALLALGQEEEWSGPAEAIPADPRTDLAAVPSARPIVVPNAAPNAAPNVVPNVVPNAIGNSITALNATTTARPVAAVVPQNDPRGKNIASEVPPAAPLEDAAPNFAPTPFAARLAALLSGCAGQPRTLLARALEEFAQKEFARRNAPTALADQLRLEAALLLARPDPDHAEGPH